MEIKRSTFLYRERIIADTGHLNEEEKIWVAAAVSDEIVPKVEATR